LFLLFLLEHIGQTQQMQQAKQVKNRKKSVNIFNQMTCDDFAEIKGVRVRPHKPEECSE